MASLIFPYYYCHNSEIVCHKTPCRSLISCLMQAVYLFFVLNPFLPNLMKVGNANDIMSMSSLW